MSTSINPKIIKHVKEMCVDRGYTILEESDRYIVTNKCHVLFTCDIKINIGYIKEIARAMTNSGVNHVIIIYNGNITINSCNMKEIKAFYNIEYFPERLFMVNITHHKLVPRHERLLKSNPDYVSIAKDKHNLPLILDADPICRYYDFRPGSILKITRNNNSIAYRLVVGS